MFSPCNFFEKQLRKIETFYIKIIRYLFVKVNKYIIIRKLFFHLIAADSFGSQFVYIFPLYFRKENLGGGYVGHNHR